MQKNTSATEQHDRSRLRALSIKQFAERYGIGRSSVYEEMKAGRLRALKIGKRTIISVDDAEEWLRNLPKM